MILIEYLGTSQNASDRLKIIPFLAEEMKHETQDKARACAILALDILFVVHLLPRERVVPSQPTRLASHRNIPRGFVRPMVCPAEMFVDVKRQATELWDEVATTEPEEDDDMGGAAPLGVLSKAAIGIPTPPPPSLIAGIGG